MQMVRSNLDGILLISPAVGQWSSGSVDLSHPLVVSQIEMRCDVNQMLFGSPSAANKNTVSVTLLYLVNR